MWGGMMEKGSRGRVRPGAARGEPTRRCGATGSRKSAAAPAPAVFYQRPYLAGGWELSRAAVVWRRARS